MDLRAQLVDLLSRLGMASLSEYVGKDKLERIRQSGKSIDSSLLSEILYLENGINVFKNKNIRLELLAGFGSKKLKESLNLLDPLMTSLRVYNDFSWGNNSKSREFLGILGIDKVVLTDKSIAVTPIEDVYVEKSLYEYQNWARKGIGEFIRNPSKQRVIVHMPTGSGKTRTMLESVCDHIRSQENSNHVVVWLAHSEELCEQAVSSFNSLWGKLGTENAHIIRLWGGSSPVISDISKPTFVVTSFQTASNMTMTHDDNRFKLFSMIRSYCTLLIVDEAHQSTAPTYKSAIELFSNYGTKIVGLTATPGRHHIGQDAEETVTLSDFYENNKINIVDDSGEDLDDPIGFLTDKGVLAKVTRFKIDSGAEIALTKKEVMYMEKYLDIPGSVLKKLGQNVKRTNLIVTQAIKLAIEDRFPTIIFAPSKESAIEIATSIQLLDVGARAITSDTPKFERQQFIANFKGGKLPILVNFGVLTTGFDAPNIKAVIIARPTTSVVLYSQMIGRGLRGRLMGGEDECYLIDVEDNIANMPGSNQAFTFFDSYY